ncbi:MAG: PadR family transcriptional regulator [Acidobacteria bacterium]|nr:PadR family transcriptional regulator [Acidobacteriota bacterium]
MSPRPKNLDEFGRFTEPAVMILVSLAEMPRHGYAIADDIERVTGVRSGPGTLYGALGRLEKRGFITPLGAEDNRTEYELSREGRQALDARLNAMATVAQLGQARLAQA